MASDNKQEAFELIETALSDTYKDTVTTSVLLLKCQRISMLLDSKQENEWIWKELEGYDMDEDVPQYRCVGLTSKIVYSRIIDEKPEEQVLTYSQLRGANIHHVFQIRAPVHYLEKSNRELMSQDRLVIPFSKDTPIRRLLGLFKITKPVEVRFDAGIPVDSMRGIASSVRNRIHEFLLLQQTTLGLKPHLQSIFDDTMNLIASKLSTLDPNLLEDLRGLIEKLQSKSDLDWRSIVDSCRTIIQRFTDSVYLEEMVPVGEEKPAYDQTRNKCRQIAVWALSQFNAKLDDSPEGSRIERIPSYLDDYYEIIIRSVEKVKHKDIRTLRKDEVDRIVIYTILWMADLIQLLSRANYSWT